MNVIKKFDVEIEMLLHREIYNKFTTDLSDVFLIHRIVNDSTWEATYVSLNISMFDLLYEL